MAALVLTLPEEAALWRYRQNRKSGFKGKVTSIREFVMGHSEREA